MNKRVFLFGIDGMGNYNTEANTPYMDKLANEGMVTTKAETVVPTISGQCWGSLFHGVLPELHGLTNCIAEQQVFDQSDNYPSFVRKMSEAKPEKDLSSFVVWDPINFGIIEEDIKMHRETLSDAQAKDAFIHHVQGKGKDVYFSNITFDMVDYAGHKFGYGSLKHLESIELADSYIGEIMNVLEEKGLLHDSLVIVTTDHGGGGIKACDHGSDKDKDRHVYMSFSGSGLKRGILTDTVSIMDIAPTVLEAMDIEIPSIWQGKVLDIFI